MEHAKIKPEVEAISQMKLNFNIRDWNFNALDQSANCLIVTVKEIYSQLNFFDDFHIDMGVFLHFLWQCHYYYTRNENPFHNFFHGVTVCHAGYFFLANCPQLADLLSPHIKLAFITACLGHDLDHRGRNNQFEMNTQSKLALRYFHNSPLEHHHAAVLFTILRSDDSNIFKHVADDQMAEIKKNMIENILATDMRLHFPMLADFKKKLRGSPDFCRPISDLRHSKRRP